MRIRREQFVNRSTCCKCRWVCEFVKLNRKVCENMWVLEMFVILMKKEKSIARHIWVCENFVEQCVNYYWKYKYRRKIKL